MELPPSTTPLLLNARIAFDSSHTLDYFDRKVVKHWRHMLQKTFLSTRNPPDSDVKFCDYIFDQLEQVQLQLGWLTYSKVAKVLRHIGVLESVSYPDSIERAHSIVMPLASLVHGHGVPERRQENALDMNPISPAIELAIQPFTTWPLDLPLELHMAILSLALQSYILPPGIKTNAVTIWNSWRSDVRQLCSFTQVSKTWAIAAKNVLYGGRIIVATSWSLSRLLDVVQSDSSLYSPKHLIAHTYDFSGGFGASLTRLVECSVNLYTLELERGFAVFDISSLPRFEYLATLRLVDQIFLAIAPLLCRLPNLETLVLHSVRDLLPHHHRPVGMVSDVSVLEPVAFKLRHLEVSAVCISSEHLTWLLSSSLQSLRHITMSPLSLQAAGIVRGYTDILDELSVTLGPIVESLRIRITRCEAFQREDLLQILGYWTNVTDLQIEGFSDVFPMAVSQPGSHLLNLAVPWSAIHVNHLCNRLQDSFWRSDLQSIRMTDVPDNLSQDEAASKNYEMLLAVCRRRNIFLRSLT